MTTRWRAAAIAVAMFASLVLGASPTMACTPCSPTLEDFISATQSIVLARWEGRADSKDTFAVLDVLRGPEIRKVALYSEYLEGRTPQGRWLLIDEGYLGLARVSDSGKVGRGGYDDGDAGGTLSDWYDAVRRVPDTATSGFAIGPSSAPSDLRLLLVSAAIGVVAVWLRPRRRRPRARMGRRLGTVLAFGVCVALSGQQAMATPVPDGVATSASPAAPALLVTRAASPSPQSTDAVEGRVACTLLAMHEHRHLAVPILLADGRVLVLGGEDLTKFWDESYHPIMTWEVFNPKTNAFDAGGKIPDRLWPKSATLLLDGRVLVNTTGRALLFNPATRSFTAAGDPKRIESYDVVARLPDGRVLVAGAGASGQVAELFDPRTRTWSETGALHTVRYLAGVAVLKDGRVLVAGGTMGVGEGALNVVDSSAEMYVPSLARFVGARPMNAPRFGFAAVTLADGRILLSGDLWDNSTASQVFDPRAGRYAPTGSMLEDLGAMDHAVRLADGRVLFIGEASDGDWPDADLEAITTEPGMAQAYDAATGRFSQVNLANPFLEFTPTALTDGRVLIVGDGPVAMVCSP